MSLPNPQLRFADRMLKGQTGSAVFDLSTELHLHTAKTMQHSVGPSEERKNVPMYGQPTLPRLPRLVHIRSSGYVLQRRGKRLLQRGLPRGVLLGLLVGPLQRLDALEQPVERQRMYVGDHVRNAILRDLRQTRVSQGARPSTMPGFSKRVNDKDPTKALSPLHQRNTLLRMLVRTPKCLCICRRDSEDIHS